MSSGDTIAVFPPPFPSGEKEEEEERKEKVAGEKIPPEQHATLSRNRAEEKRICEKVEKAILLFVKRNKGNGPLGIFHWHLFSLPPCLPAFCTRSKGKALLKN